MSSHWADGEMVALDTETTGVEIESDHVLTTAIVHIRPGQEAVIHRWVINPGVEVPEEAARIHGYPTERVRAEGVEPARALDEITTRLSSLWSDSAPVVTSNGSYDLSILDRNIGRHLGAELVIAGPMIDVLLVDRNCDKYRPGSRKLADMCRHWGIELPDAHEAAADAVAAARLAWKLGKCRRWPRGRYGPSVAERHARALVAAGDAVTLHDAQVRWAEIDSLSLANYWRTPKAVAKTWEKVSRGELTREEAEVWIAGLPAAADRVEASAVGCWPLVPRVPVAT